MKDPIQQKENKQASPQNESSGAEGGQTMSPPSFSLTSAPIQKKDDPKPQPKKPKTPQEEFVAKYASSAVALEKKDGIPALFTLAQGALESGWGKKAIGNALFGIKAGSSWKGKKQLVTTTEILSDDKQGSKFPEVISIKKITEGKDSGKYKYTVKDYFRDYETVEEGLEDHGSFLKTNKRYAGAFNTETPQAFAQAVADAGYATVGDYGGLLKTMIASVKKRWPSDVPIPSGNAKAITGGKPGGVAVEPGKDTPSAAPAAPVGKQAGAAAKPAVSSGKTISASVGEKGVNTPADALVIKELMIKAGYDLTMIPAIGPKTIGYIKAFQTKKFGWKNPDGLIEPGGSTFKALAGGGGGGAAKPAAAKKPATAAKGSPAKAPAAMDYNSMAQKINTAMFGGYFGLGTDEDAIYAELKKLGRDASKIQAFKSSYKKKYGRDLTVDLRSEFSGTELTKVLDYLSPKKDSAPAKGETKPKTVPAKAPAKDTPGGQKAGSTGNKLDEFYKDFSNIKVVHGDKTVNVKPPYHINDFHRKTAALAARDANPKVKTFINKLSSAGKISSGAKIGKSQPADLKVILEAAVDQGLVTHDSAKMVDFLAKYGLSVDCSGYVSQALNFLMDGNKTVDSKDGLVPNNTASGSLKGGTGNFTKVNIGDVKAGDTMHLSGHIRIINEVVKDGKTVYFRTAESTAAVNPKDGENGLMKRWWKWDGAKKYYSWEKQNGAHPAADDKSWKQSTESNTFGRYKKLTAS